jgi:hypothetical protein
VIPVVEEISQALDVLFEPRSEVELRAFTGRLSKFGCDRYTAYKLYGVWRHPQLQGLV